MKFLKVGDRNQSGPVRSAAANSAKVHSGAAVSLQMDTAGRVRDRDPTDPHQLKSGMLSLTNLMETSFGFLDGSEQLSQPKDVSIKLVNESIYGWWWGDLPRICSRTQRERTDSHTHNTYPTQHADTHKHY